MTQYSPITKYEEYTRKMTASMMDKLFFLDKIDAQLIVDFGCADGALLVHCMDWIENTRLVGFDNDPEMTKLAQYRFGPHPDDNRLTFTSDWRDVEALLSGARNRKTKTALILSSVLHEVYHYSDPKAVDIFWRKHVFARFGLAATLFDFIVIRDMIPSVSLDRRADDSDVAKVLRKSWGTKELSDFQKIWGSIDSNKNLVHWLLKYKYLTPNWEREVRENYIPLYYEDLMTKIPEGYEVLYKEHYTLPYLKRQVRQDFGIELKDPTHLKIILERR